MLTYVFLHLPGDPSLLSIAAAEDQDQVARVAVDPDQTEEDLLQPEALGGDGQPVFLHRCQEHLVLVSQHPHTLVITLCIYLEYLLSLKLFNCLFVCIQFF